MLGKMKQHKIFFYRQRQFWSNINVAGKVSTIFKYFFASYLINFNIIAGVSNGNDRGTSFFLLHS